MLVKILVDGCEFEVESTGNLITELKKHNIEIPHFCYHEALGVSGNCRMCLVEVGGQKRPQIACDTPIKEGMEIFTNSALTRSVQRGILELELINHPIDCPICDQAGECDLQDFYMKYDLQSTRISPEFKVKKPKAMYLGKNVIHDSERCVLCRRCVRFTQKYTQTFELGVGKRGEHSQIITFKDRPIHNDYAGNIVDICPVGAMTNKDFRFKKRVWHLKPTQIICQLCEKNCSMWADTHKEKYKKDAVFRFRPRQDMAVNGYFICDDGRYSYKFCDTKHQFIEDEKLEILKEKLQNKQVDLIVTSSLSLEEMHALKLVAEHFGVNLRGFKDYLDEQKADNLLKMPNKTPNARGLDLLNISLDLSGLRQELIVFDLSFKPQVVLNALKSKRLSFVSPNEIDQVPTMLCSNFLQRNGTTINSDNLLRQTNKALENYALSIEEIAQKLINKSIIFDKTYLENFAQKAEKAND